MKDRYMANKDVPKQLKGGQWGKKREGDMSCLRGVDECTASYIPEKNGKVKKCMNHYHGIYVK